VWGSSPFSSRPLLRDRLQYVSPALLGRFLTPRGSLVAVCGSYGFGLVSSKCLVLIMVSPTTPTNQTSVSGRKKSEVIGDMM
jgi:hypothetical protein